VTELVLTVQRHRHKIPERSIEREKRDKDSIENLENIEEAPRNADKSARTKIEGLQQEVERVTRARGARRERENYRALSTMYTPRDEREEARLMPMGRR
jgi:hypothetical protein